MRAAELKDSSFARPMPVIVFAVLALVLALRLAHLSSELRSPLSFQPGPDEDYYQRFGAAVAAGQGADTPEFTFMDPGYGYLLGAAFKAVGVNAAAIYLLQALLDTATAFGILAAGRLLGRPRAGLLGALLYGVTSTAIMFCASLLKETCVASFVIWWMVGALALLRSERPLAWLGFGALCGIGIALRSTLLLLGVAALALPAFKRWGGGAGAADGARAALPAFPHRLRDSALVFAGMAAALAPWSVRNHRADGGFSPLPHNGGIVLHQIYNAQNPQSAIWIPPFVNYSNPSEIWRGYAAEAQRIAGRPLRPTEVDRYWKDQALGFMWQHPGTVVEDVLRKSLVFLAATEVPNNRSSMEERLFSPVLSALPVSMAWLLAMGLAGTAWFAIQDRRWLVVAAPIAIAWLTMAVFWAEDRFRFHAAPALALMSGVWLDGLIGGVRRGWQAPAAGLLAAAIAAASLYLGTRFPPPPMRWDHIVWGYIKMGNAAQARALAERVSRDQPDNAPIAEALGYLAAAQGRYQDAVREYRRAVDLRPRSYLARYNLAKAYLALGLRAQAAEEAKAAASLDSSDEIRSLEAQIEAAP